MSARIHVFSRKSRSLFPRYTERAATYQILRFWILGEEHQVVTFLTSYLSPSYLVVDLHPAYPLAMERSILTRQFRQPRRYV